MGGKGLGFEILEIVNYGEVCRGEGGGDSCGILSFCDRNAAISLVCGNTNLWKPAESVSLIAIACAKVGHRLNQMKLPPRSHSNQSEKGPVGRRAPSTVSHGPMVMASLSCLPATDSAGCLGGVGPLPRHRLPDLWDGWRCGGPAREGPEDGAGVLHRQHQGEAGMGCMVLAHACI